MWKTFCWERTTTTGDVSRTSQKRWNITRCSIRSCRRKRLLYRLFHEEGVRAGEPRQLEVFCRCSQERVENLIRSFQPEEIEDLRDDDGNIVVTCEFCSSTYRCPDVGA